MNFILIQFILLTIVLMSALIAREFYISKNGQLRRLMVFLFLAKVWVYGGASILFFIWPPEPQTLVRVIVLNFPMMVVMLNLWRYIRLHNQANR